MARKKKTPPQKAVHHQFEKVSEEALKALMEAQQDAQLASARAQQLSAGFQLQVAETLKSVGAPIATSAICLTCGTVRPQQLPCPECKQA